MSRISCLFIISTLYVPLVYTNLPPAYKAQLEIFNTALSTTPPQLVDAQKALQKMRNFWATDHTARNALTSGIARALGQKPESKESPVVYVENFLKEKEAALKKLQATSVARTAVSTPAAPAPSVTAGPPVVVPSAPVVVPPVVQREVSSQQLLSSSTEFKIAQENFSKALKLVDDHKGDRNLIQSYDELAHAEMFLYKMLSFYEKNESNPLLLEKIQTEIGDNEEILENIGNKLQKVANLRAQLEVELGKKSKELKQAAHESFEPEAVLREQEKKLVEAFQLLKQNDSELYKELKKKLHRSEISLVEAL